MDDTLYNGYIITWMLHQIFMYFDILEVIYVAAGKNNGGFKPLT